MQDSGASPRPSSYRWVIIGLIFLVTLINIINRLTISVLGPTIVQKLALTNLQFGDLTTLFLIAYAASQALSGKFYDRVGIRKGFSFSVVIWSIAATLHALATSFLSLGLLRFVLGIGEAGNWPGAAKVVGEWFPTRERAFAMALFNSGAALGSVIAIPLIAGLNIKYGWQATFVVTGLLGFVWLVIWLIAYRDPPSAGGAEIPKVPIPSDGYRALLKDRRALAIVLSRFFTDPVWWLYITWLPLYLYQVYGFDLKKIAMFGWMPYVAADAGSLLGGWASGYLMRLGWSWSNARRFVLIVSTLMMACGLLAARTSSAMSALVVISIVLFGFQAWINNVQVLPADYFEARNVGSVAGLGGLGAGIGSILFTRTTGWVTDHWSYTPILIIAGLLPIVGTALLLIFTDNLKHEHLQRV